MIFPQASGTNLLRQKMTLPDDLQGENNILLIAFQQRQQASVDSWVPLLRDLEQTYPVVKFYELPVIYKMNFLSQTFLNEGMRAGIPNMATRAKTITLYLDKTKFRRDLAIPNEDAIVIMVVDRSGTIIWRSTGSYSEEKGAELLQAIQEFSAHVKDS